MKFKKQVFGYDKKQVDDLVLSSKKTFLTMEEQKERIVSLVKENEELKEKLKEYENRDKSVSRTISAANDTADDIISKAQSIYEMEIKRVKTFQLLWEQVANKLLEHSEIGKSEEINQLSSKLDTLLKNYVAQGSSKTSVNTANLINPVSKVTGMLDAQMRQDEETKVAASRPVIELSEVAKVTKTLEELCKELGLI